MAGLAKHGIPELALDAIQHAVEAALDLATRDTEKVNDRQTHAAPQRLVDDFVHAERRTEHTRTDIRHARQLEQALDGAVLAVGAVQDGEHKVEAASVPSRDRPTPR